MTIVSFNKSDVCDDAGYFGMLGDFLTNHPDKISGVAAQGFSLRCDHELAGRCEVVSSFTAVLSAGKGVIELFQATLDCDVRNAVYHSANFICDFVDGIKFFETSDKAIPLPEKLVALAPFCEIGVCAVDIYHGISDLRAAGEGDKGFCELRNRERKYTLVRNVLLAGVAALGLTGVAMGATALFGCSIAALLLTMGAFFAKQQLKEYAITNRSLTFSA